MQLITLMGLLLLQPGCNESAEKARPSETSINLASRVFGDVEGTPVHLYTITNPNDLRCTLTNYGATVVTVETPDRNGEIANINLGFNSLEGYKQDHPYFGSTIGRFANRIAKARFTLDGTTYRLTANEGSNHLHGGTRGFHKVIWEAEEVRDENSAGIRFHYLSPDGEEGYPGNLDVTVTYSLTATDELRIEYEATTDQATPVNLTNHNYWNLNGAGQGTILDHVLTIAGDRYLEVDDDLIPTGKITLVDGGPMDFTTPKSLGQDMEKLTNDPRGYDHCYVLSGGNGLKLAARLKSPESGRVMEVHTTQPAIQFYSGNFLDGSPESGGYPQYSGLCLETQHYPDSPNHPDFPSVILRPGEKYHQVTIHKFLVE